MKRLLFVTARLPCPPREGHQLRSWHVLKALSRTHHVSLISCLRPDDDPSDAALARDIASEVVLIPLIKGLGSVVPLLRGMFGPTPYIVHKYANHELRDEVRKLARTVDCVHFDMLPLMSCASEVPAESTIVYNAHNIEHELLAVRASNERRPVQRTYLRSQVGKLRRFEEWAARRADLVLACSEVDARKLRALGARNLAVVPNGADLQFNQPGVEGSGQTLVFVGQMGWFPNRDGVEWFLAEIFPRILEARPATRFVIVGKSDGLIVPANLAAHVEVTGFVEDLRPVVQAAAVYVVPLRMGSGTRLKVLEAMALGKAIVSTRVGAEGIALEDGRHVVFADDVEAFSTRVIELLDKPSLRASLGQAAHALAEDQYGWDAIGERMLPHYAALTPNG